jgi:hypothetical protein
MFDLSQYETVDQRLEKFWAKYPDGAIITELVAHKDDRFIFKASVYKTFVDSVPFATGFAEEIVTGRGVNSTSALENSESSAIGRALHTGGISKHSEGKPRPSAEEMSKVNRAAEVKTKVEEVKAKMADTSKEYVPVPVESDPWNQSFAAPVQTVQQAVETVKSILGGTTEKDIQRCPHGEMIWKTGQSKAGKPWGHFRCVNQVTAGMPGASTEKCEPIWYEIAKDGSWRKQANRG